jgi:hypothetical protein
MTSRRAPGDIVATTRRGVTIRYSPSQGSSVRYRVTCPHGASVNDRTLADAREDARDPSDWCAECADQQPQVVRRYRATSNPHIIDILARESAQRATAEVVTATKLAARHGYRLVQE